MITAEAQDRNRFEEVNERLEYFFLTKQVMPCHIWLLACLAIQVLMQPGFAAALQG